MRICIEYQYRNIALELELDVLDKLLGLDIVHAMDTGNTITIPMSVPISFRNALQHNLIPDGEDTASLSETCLFLDTCAIISIVTHRPGWYSIPRIRCSRMEETSVGDAFASDAYALIACLATGVRTYESVSFGLSLCVGELHDSINSSIDEPRIDQ
jgi:hypothetical protein